MVGSAIFRLRQLLPEPVDQGAVQFGLVVAEEVAGAAALHFNMELGAAEYVGVASVCATGQLQKLDDRRTTAAS
ncbi:MAG: hypothetical protein IPH05_05590 [Flavobacteriales bacterium]|jgi:hypothetical protein|nr:hypothetical protein [Flavobacteriales bacterium]MBK7112088.1 hypothetical protein [Flavobacteriales bacterium]MBP8879028.1 hypothetical protein [Flavobacteriales bacterium]HQW04488.1 hypothetical protein [Flavobacteriales bacterium]HQY00624.1 hypothetical protein [Flavobacteriales bacterium]